MNKNNEFIKNTFILFLGKFATQFMSLLLLPLYTHFLLADDFGLVDLFQTYITLFVPILTLRIDSAAFRFLIDKREDEDGIKKEISNIFVILLVSLISVLIIVIILYKIINIKYFLEVVINLIILMTSNVLLQLLRGLGKNKEYSIASVLTGITTLISNIVLIILFKWGANSILISSSIANFLCIIYITLKISLPKRINYKFVTKKNIKEILKYSYPMIANSLSWWIVNVSDRTIISIFLSTAFNGIYTVSCKFSNILNSVFSIFNMSWQESASLHIEDEDRNTFFTQMINQQLMLFASLSLIIIAILPFIYNLVIGNDYLSSYKYIPILLYANTWNVLTSLIGGVYIAKKMTKEVANTTIFSALINIIINLIFIKFIGLYAACISTVLSYMILGIYRYVDSKKYLNIELNVKKIIIYSILFCVSSYLYIKNIFWINIINLIVVLIYSFLENKEIFRLMKNMVLKKVKKFKYKNKFN